MNRVVYFTKENGAEIMVNLSKIEYVEETENGNCVLVLSSREVVVADTYKHVVGILYDMEEHDNKVRRLLIDALNSVSRKLSFR